MINTELNSNSWVPDAEFISVHIQRFLSPQLQVSGLAKGFSQGIHRKTQPWGKTNVPLPGDSGKILTWVLRFIEDRCNFVVEDWDILYSVINNKKWSLQETI